MGYEIPMRGFYKMKVFIGNEGLQGGFTSENRRLYFRYKQRDKTLIPARLLKQVFMFDVFGC